MPRYLGSSLESGSAARLGVLVANLGTPDAPSPAAVRRFLAQFLWDPRVVETPRPLWWLILNGVILRLRPRRSAHAYQQIWTPQGSPLLLYSREITAAIQARLRQRFGSNVIVGLGMSYGTPDLSDTLERMYGEGVRRLLVLPLYPQYSATTTASVFDRVTGFLQRLRWVPELRFISDYHADDGYVEALAESVSAHWRIHERRHLLFSFHGIPRSYVNAGDPYLLQCQQTARLVSQRLQLAPDQWSMSFQSQVGRAEWLRPYTDELLLEYAKGAHRRITVMCPGFATDCLETLEEIALRNRELFLANGGEAYDYVPALNAERAHIDALTGIIERHCQGWDIPGSTVDGMDAAGPALRRSGER